MKQRFWWYNVGGIVSVLIALAPLSAQTDTLFDEKGPTGSVTDETDSTTDPTPGGATLQSSYVGPLGRVDDRVPHTECETCFTVPGLSEERYQIFEPLDLSGEELLIPRMVPNPAPLRPNEIRERYDEETGEDIWYIGHQAFIGPTDDEQWTDTLSYSRIELQRIQMEYQEEIMGIAGVHRFGLGPD